MCPAAPGQRFPVAELGVYLARHGALAVMSWVWHGEVGEYAIGVRQGGGSSHGRWC